MTTQAALVGVADLQLALGEFSCAAATVLTAGEVNRAMRELAAVSVSEGCLAFRQATNALRLANRSGVEDVLEALAGGRLVASSFHPHATRATFTSSEVTITGAGLMTTGVWYAEHILVEAAHGAGSSIVVVPAAAITRIARPTLVGLMTADNALIDIDITVPIERVVGEIGGASAIVNQPYDAGLTFGAIADGAADALSDLLRPAVERLDPHQQQKLGEALARSHAAAALTASVSQYAPTAGWWSRAAKVASTTAALELSTLARDLLGSPTYATGHPLNELEADIRGLIFQAPTHAGAAAHLARHRPHHPDPTHHEGSTP